MFIVTTNHLEHLDAALYRDDRFDQVIKMQLADRFQCNEIFYNFFKRRLDPAILEMLPEDKFAPAKFIFFLSKYIWSELSDKELIETFLELLPRER
jgi:SpoVK/Ycf46/Vps4 family AAA+-type ATPase